MNTYIYSFIQEVNTSGFVGYILSLLHIHLHKKIQNILSFLVIQNKATDRVQHMDHCLITAILYDFFLLLLFLLIIIILIV